MASRPIKRPINGLEVANRIDWAVSLPNIVTEALTKSMEKRKKKIAKSIIRTDQYHFGGVLSAFKRLFWTIKKYLSLI